MNVDMGREREPPVSVCLSHETHRDEEAEEGAVREPLAVRGVRPEVRVPEGLPQLRHLEQL